MKLYYFNSANPRKACVVARYLDSPVEYVRIDLGRRENTTPEYLAINPNGKVPTLVDGERVLWEADAIMCYLAQKAGSDLWPRDPDRQIEVIRWLSWNAYQFSPHAGLLYFDKVIRPRFNLPVIEAERLEAAMVNFRKFAAVLDTHLESRDYLTGKALSVADFSVAITLPFADVSGIPLAEFPNIERWHGRLNELEAWRDPFPADGAAA